MPTCGPKRPLLEARFLCGDETLFTEFEKTFERRCLRGQEKEYLEWRIEDQRERHEKAGNTVFLQEPNVKNGCGGLRDYQNLLWIGEGQSAACRTPRNSSTRN